MLGVSVCRNMYPSWESTRRYLDGIRGEIALFPEECLRFHRDSWDENIVADYLKGRNTSIVIGLYEKVAVIHNGKVDYYPRKSEPIFLDTSEGKVATLVRICAQSLETPKWYDVKGDLLMVSSAIKLLPNEVVRHHDHNLKKHSLALYSSYDFKDCWVSDLHGNMFGEVYERNGNRYLEMAFTPQRSTKS